MLLLLATPEAELPLFRASFIFHCEPRLALSMRRHEVEPGASSCTSDARRQPPYQFTQSVESDWYSSLWAMHVALEGVVL